MKAYTCIAIDDELSSLENLKNYIELHPNLRLLHSFSDSTEAFKFITSNDIVDLIFIDVEMPKISGLELASAIRHKIKKLIFTTGHTKYGYQAFELEANAFLLKPYTFMKFSHTIQKIFQEQNDELNTEKITESSFYVKHKNNLLKIYFDDVIAFESKLHDVTILTKNQNIVVHWSLAEIKRLLPEEFIQVHRSFIISEKHIQNIEGNNIRLNNNLSINIGRNYKEHFENIINKKTIKLKN